MVVHRRCTGRCLLYSSQPFCFASLLVIKEQVGKKIIARISTCLVIGCTLACQERWRARRGTALPQPVIEFVLHIGVRIYSVLRSFQLLLNVLEDLAVVIDLSLTNCRDVGPVIDGVWPESEEEVGEVRNSNAWEISQLVFLYK